MKVLSFVFLFVFAVSISAQSTKVDDLFSEGTRLANAGRFDAALTSYKGALNMAESEYLDAGYRARLRFNTGVCYFRLGQFDRAVGEFKLAILLRKDYAQAHDALSVAEARKRESKLSTASFKASE